mmetsp:Transcript_43078/g.63892  ORF Transcript_43078/g.63892 Transcript_43078/m.63892 type:complete len:93 (-) Transcript_43078:49-327(-)
MQQRAVSTKKKVVELGKKHRITERTQAAADSCWSSMKAAGERHRIAERTKSCLGSTRQGIQLVNSTYQLAERTVKAAGIACNLVGTQRLRRL